MTVHLPHGIAAARHVGHVSLRPRSVAAPATLRSAAIASWCAGQKRFGSLRHLACTTSRVAEDALLGLAFCCAAQSGRRVDMPLAHLQVSEAGHVAFRRITITVAR